MNDHETSTVSAENPPSHEFPVSAETTAVVEPAVDFSDVIEYNTDSIWVLEARRDEASGAVCDLVIVTMNSSARREHPTEAGPLGSTLAVVWPDSLVNGIHDDCLRVLTTGTEVIGDMQWTERERLMPSGFEYRAVAIGVDTLMLMLRYTTESLRTAQALREREAQSRAVLAALEEGIVVQAANGDILESNQSALDILDPPVGTLQAGSTRNPWQLAMNADGMMLGPDDLPTSRALASGVAVQNETVGVQRNDGRLVWVSLNVHPLVHAASLVPYATVTSFRDITARRAAEQELMQQALYDSLTGAANRFLLLDRLTLMVAGAKRHRDSPVPVPGVMFLDLDRFKTVNDRYGHAAGDHVLVTVTERLRSIVRANDTVARLGGDEFVVLVDQTTPDDLTALAQRVTRAVAEPVPWVTDSGDPVMLSVSASIGVARDEAQALSPAELLHIADAAMYEHKTRREESQVDETDSDPT